jgi:hypothetical protein
MIGTLSTNVANDKCLRKTCREILGVENTPGNLGIDGRRVIHYNLKKILLKDILNLYP